MTRIGLLSDTHGFLDKKILKYFEDCDEIWHAGDFGNLEVANQLSDWKPLRGVYGNIDAHNLRNRYPLDQQFTLEGLNIYITHIGGYPGRYDRRVSQILHNCTPHLFVCGHSHILKVMKDPAYNNMLVLNPGAAGIVGFHKFRTVLRFCLNRGKIQNLEAIQLGKRSDIGVL